MAVIFILQNLNFENIMSHKILNFVLFCLFFQLNIAKADRARAPLFTDILCPASISLVVCHWSFTGHLPQNETPNTLTHMIDQDSVCEIQCLRLTRSDKLQVDRCRMRVLVSSFHESAFCLEFKRETLDSQRRSIISQQFLC